jgi:hypothetical protein
MGRQRRAWIPKYEGFDDIIKARLGEREHRQFLRRLEGAIQAMETIASTPELARAWRAAPAALPDVMPPHIRAAFEAMIGSYVNADVEDEAPSARSLGVAAERARPGILAVRPLRGVRAGGASRRARTTSRQAPALQVGTHDGTTDGARRPATTATLRLVVRNGDQKERARTWDESGQGGSRDTANDRRLKSSTRRRP